MSRIIENPAQLILDTARNILFTEGYSKLSMRNIARECCIGIGTIYNYFPTKMDLIIGMMSVHWNNYFDILEKLVSNDDTTYIKLNNIFSELEVFIKVFKEVWLKPELYQAPGYIRNGLKRENIYIEKLIRRLEAFLISESLSANSTIKMKFDSYETAKFIVLNYITIIQMPTFSYQSFEIFLKELLQ